MAGGRRQFAELSASLELSEIPGWHGVTSSHLVIKADCGTESRVPQRSNRGGRVAKPLARAAAPPIHPETIIHLPSEQTWGRFAKFLTRPIGSCRLQIQPVNATA
ncbi:hypothetical protein CBM2623_A220080 [Cupriavidus taiwanensis]|nr:hypothetical protein CBM2623_A220080 [Cupriavidus taiwanensis]